MRSDPLSPPDVLRALELFGPQARPYNFDDCFDCWGLVRRVFDHLDDGDEIDEELGPPGDPREAGWVAFAGPDELVPGDLLTTHRARRRRVPHRVLLRPRSTDSTWSTTRRRGRSSRCSSGRTARWCYVGERAIAHPLRARDRDDRPPAQRRRRLSAPVGRSRAVLQPRRARTPRWRAGRARPGAIWSQLRGAAGLSGAAVLLPPPAAARPCRPRGLRQPAHAPPRLLRPGRRAGRGRRSRRGRRGPSCRERRRGAGRAAPAGAASHAGPAVGRARRSRVRRVGVRRRDAAPAVTGCRVEIWEETWDLLEAPAAAPGPRAGHHLVRRAGRPAARRQPLRRGRVGARAGRLLGNGARAVPLPPGSRQPAPRVRPRPAGRPASGRRSRRARRSARRAHLAHPRGRALAGERHRRRSSRTAASSTATSRSIRAELSGAAAAACRVLVPGELLRAGHTYSWYVSVRAADGRTAFAPAEGVFRVSGEG